MDFESSNSFAYRFARYVILPELQASPEAKSGEPFLLREVAWPLIDAHLSPQQQATLVKRAQSDAMLAVGANIRFYVPFLARETGAFISLGKGLFRNATVDDVPSEEVLDAAIDEAESSEAADFDGHVYAFSFPMIMLTDKAFPVKIGMTTGDVQQRVLDQCKSSGVFEMPIVLGTWAVKRVGPTERAVHNVLKARGKWRELAPGKEWFDTTVTEVKAIIEFVVSDQVGAALSS